MGFEFGELRTCRKAEPNPGLGDDPRALVTSILVSLLPAGEHGTSLRK